MHEYYMFNKPAGCVTARRDERHKTVMDYFPNEKRDVLFPVGRLDRDTEGFLIVTDDGELCFNILSPAHHISKTYFFIATGELTDAETEKIEGGVQIYKNSDFVTAPAKIRVAERLTFRDIARYLPNGERPMSERRAAQPAVSGYITVTEGKKHQVRRMIRHVGCKVVFLKRVKIGELYLDESLSPGEYRSLTEKEIALLKGRYDASCATPC